MTIVESGKKFGTVAVIGGAGYVGAVLVPRLLEEGYRVRVFDLFIYGDEALAAVRDNPHLEIRHGDVRDLAAVKEAVRGADAGLEGSCDQVGAIAKHGGWSFGK